MPTTYAHKNYRVTVEDDGSIRVQKGDWLSKYSAAIHAGDTTKVKDFGRMDRGVVEVVDDVNLEEGKTIFHIPTYNKALSGNPRMKALADAHRLINDCESRIGQPIAFKIISRYLVVEGLRERVMSPDKIDQGRAYVCPGAALVRNIAKDKPDVYAKLVIDLFEKGVGHIGTWEIKPSSDLKMYQIPLSPHGMKAHPADWIPMASIRDSENEFFDYQQIDMQWHWSINWIVQVAKSGGATLDELVSWLEKSGYTDIIKGEGSTWPLGNQRTRGNIKLASDYWGLGYKVIFLLDANILYPNWQVRGESGRPNHIVVLTSRVNFQIVGGGQNLSMTVYTWGSGNHRIPNIAQLSVDDFLKYYYGFVAAKY